jgi:hypothetical protein
MLGNWFGAGVAKLALGKRPLQFVLVWALVFGLVVGAAMPNGAQTPTPTVDDEIVRQAKEDAEMGTAQKRKEFRDAFAKDANQKSRSPEDLDKLYTKYVEAYNKAKDAKEVDPKEAAKAPLQDPIGWLMFLVAGASVGIFKDAVSNAIKKVWTTITTWIYQRFSGRWWFWNLALEKYRKALVEKHGELKIPFRPNRPLKMDEVYVPLKVVGNRTDKENVEAMQAVRDYRRLMVTGQPGSGKTMLLRYLALNYGVGKLRLVDEPVLILLELWRLSDGAEILEELVSALKRDDFPNGKDFLEQALGQGRVVLLLDGLDEVNTEKRPAAVKRIKDFLDTREKCRVVITCRSQVYQGEFDGVVKQTLEVMEFTDAQIQQFLRPWQVEMPAEKSIQQLVQSLNNRPRIKELARNPLLLTIIAYLYCDTSFVLPHSRAEFYAKSTEILLETWDQARQTPNLYKGFTKRLVLQHLALYAQDNAGERQQDRKTLSFQEVMAEIKTVLPGLDLDPEKDASTILAEIVERSGLLLRIDGGAKYQFSHLTLQEFFAAEALRDQSDKMIQRVETDLDAWREVVKLWCGLANDSTAVIQAIYPTNKVVTTTEVSRAALTLECLASAQKVDNNFAARIIDELTPRLGNRRSLNPRYGNNTRNESIQEAFGAVAADPRPRGQKVFDNLVKLFNQTENPEVRAYEAERKILAAIAISHSNRPDAAEQMLSGYPRFSEVRKMIVRLGDLAVPCLKTCTENQDRLKVKSALNDLVKIGTPEAAKALVPLLWHPELPISGQTAWYLARLMTQPEIEATLTNNCSLPHSHSNEYHDWVWEPFAPATNRNHPISVITGRIAYLLDKAPIEVIPQPIPLVDPRLILPVCAIGAASQVTLPTKWPANADSLLLGASNNSAILGKVGDILGNIASDTKWRRSSLAALSPKLQLDLLKRLITFSRSPQPQDWPNIFQRVKFDFERSWQYNLIVLISFLASTGAITESLYLPLQMNAAWTSWLFGLPVVVILYAWIFVWRGIEVPGVAHKRLAPSLFMQFGVFGWRGFWYELKRLIQGKAVWAGAEAFFGMVTNDEFFAFAAAAAFAFAAAGSIAGAFSGAGTFSVSLAVTFTIAFTIASTVAVAGDSAVAVAVADTIAFAFAAAGAAASSVAFAAAGSIAGVFSGAVAFGGIIFWYKEKSNTNNKSRFWAILAYPFFCAAPFVVIYSAIGLHNWFNWFVVAGIWIVLMMGCTALWQWGQAKERKARNPLQGILDGYVPNPNLHTNRRKGFFTSPKS